MPTENVPSVDACAKLLFEKLGPRLMVAAPLGIGKPNHLLNALWSKARSDSALTLEIFTALSLQIPQGKSLLERRFLQAFT
ncbi:MAG: acetyl-CoA hydrolase, partial [Pseudomonadales bacterium]|nr:acetyl-CoA hydrolase [Pseudomonadales bacterium]